MISPADAAALRLFARGKRTSVALWTTHNVSFLALVVIQFVVFSYFFTTLIFTNHTFPNSWLYEYPSYKTNGEGRWLADLIIALQGGSGVQSFQMAVGVALQAANGILFATLVLGIESRLKAFLVAAFVCLYPAFLDDYSFTADNLTFALGDTFALIGIICCRQRAKELWFAVAAVACFVLSIAAYQPKIALIVFLCLGVAVTSIASGDTPTRDFQTTVADIASPFVILIAAVVLYYISIKLTLTQPLTEHTYLNSASEVMGLVVSAYRDFIRYFTLDADYLPLRLRFLPATGIVLGCVALLARARKRGALEMVLALVLLSLVPLALHSTYIINKYTWNEAGRILYVHAYALAFFLGYALQWRVTEKVSLVIIVLLTYWCSRIDTQETSAAMLKTNYELATVNRIASRVEDVTEDLYDGLHPTVVIGHFPEFDLSKYLAHPNRKNQAQALTYGFEAYRQVEILNFAFGKDVVRWPSLGDVVAAISSSRGRAPWPSRESVYLDGRVVVILLERPRVGVPITWVDGVRPPDTAVVNRALHEAAR